MLPGQLTWARLSLHPQRTSSQTASSWYQSLKAGYSFCSETNEKLRILSLWLWRLHIILLFTILSYLISSSHGLVVTGKACNKVVRSPYRQLHVLACTSRQPRCCYLKFLAFPTHCILLIIDVCASLGFRMITLQMPMMRSVRRSLRRRTYLMLMSTITFRFIFWTTCW
jgi:hypothetical protein